MSTGATKAEKAATVSNLAHANDTAGPFFQKKDTEAFFGGKEPGFFNPGKTQSIIQPKLNIHPANDPFEKEADAVAERVVQQLHSPPVVQRQKSDEEETVQTMPLSQSISSLQMQRPFESPTILEQNSANSGSDEFMDLQRQADSSEPMSEHSDGLEGRLQRAKGSGSALPENTRSKMESGFGADFRGVRIHNDNEAVQMNQQLGARAFAHGSDIYFNKGEYQPETKAGQQLLAHELTHTVQQNGGASISSAVQKRPNEFNLQEKKNFGILDQASNSSFNNQLPEKSNKLISSNPYLQTVPPEHVFQENDTSAKRVANQASDQISVTSNKGVQRAVDSGSGISKEFKHPQKGEINAETSTIVIPTLPIPSLKLDFHKGELEVRKETRKEQETQQEQKWKDGVKGILEDTKIKSKLEEGDALKPAPNQLAPRYILKLRNADVYVVGTQSEIKNQIAIPKWNKGGNPQSYQIDHKKETQLGGADEFENLWLLEASANQSVGPIIGGNIRNKVEALLKAASEEGPKQIFKTKPKYNDVKSNYSIKFKRAIEDEGSKVAGKSDRFYKSEEINQSLHALKALKSKDIKKLGLESDDILNIFSRESGGENFQIKDWDPISGKKKIEKPAGQNLEITDVTYKDGLGEIVFKIIGKKSRRFIKGESPIKAPLKSLSGIPNAAYIGEKFMSEELSKKLEAVSLSPIEFREVSIEPEKGIVARGQIKSSIKVIENAAIDLVLDGDEVYLQKVFNTGEFKVPSPFKISDSSLSISVGTAGIQFEGQVDFGIERVGQGAVQAYINTNKEFGVRGSFEFDKKLFDNAKVEVSYEKGEWALKGTIGIPKGKVKGIKKASAVVEYSQGVLSASGEVEPDIKGVKQGSFDLKYAQDQFAISGKLQLSQEIPKLKKGEINVSLESGAEGGYILKGNGVAEFDFPGISSGLNIQYDNGLLTIEATVNFEKGIAKGDIKAGVTNRPVDAEGTPQGEPSDKWTIYGGGTLSVKITPWLQVGAGVRFLPNGELEVIGKIELPSTVDVFPSKSIEKTLFSLPTVEIPLFAIPLGPKSLGLVAQIQGGLDFNASIGPGQLKGLYGQIQYNPSHPEETTLSGGGSFVIPAEAGLKLHADLTLGLSAGIASLTGGIEVAAGAGLKGEASATVELNWGPTTGLELNAEGRITVQPKFKFDVNLLARASLDLLVHEFSKEWRYNLASLEWGPDFEFGLIFPIHYKEGQPFNISFDDIQVIKPNIDIVATAKGLANKVKEEVF
jgi:hypothetical protein